MSIIEAMKENLGLAPLPDEEKKNNLKDTPKDEPKDEPKGTPQDKPEDKPEDEPQDNPEDKPQEDKPKKKPRRVTNIEEVVELLEEKGYKVERRDLAKEPAPAEPAPTPDKQASYVPARDTTPKIYQNQHLGVRMVQDGDFYNNLANSAYEFDRMFGHADVKLNPSVVSWIGSLYPDCPELAEDIIKNRLREILYKNPSLITEVKTIAKEATEGTIPYAPTFISKLDDTEFESEADARSAMKPYEAIGATMSKAYNVRFRRRHFDNTLGEIVDPKDVINFVKKYDGDRKKLCHELWLSYDAVFSKSSVSSSDAATSGEGD